MHCLDEEQSITEQRYREEWAEVRQNARWANHRHSGSHTGSYERARWLAILASSVMLLYMAYACGA